MPDDNSQEVEDPKDQETSDWTDIKKLANKSNVKPYSIETLATSKVPHNIPYLEVYRTDELYYQPYTSPFLSSGVDGTTSAGGGGSDSSGSGGGSGSSVLWTELSKIVADYYPRSTNKDYWIGELRKANNNWASVANVVNKMGGDKDKQNTVIRKVLETKKKFPYDSQAGQLALSSKSIADKVYSSKSGVEKLRNALLETVRKYYKSGIHHSVIVNRYMEAENSRVSIGARTLVFRKYLKSGITPSTVNKAVLDVKKKYSK